jgi:hypothetical protein
LKRVVAYEQVGRSQDEKGAKQVDRRIKKIMKEVGLGFDLVVPGDSYSTEPIVELINEKIAYEKNYRKNYI